jgi:competence protein ComEC
VGVCAVVGILVRRRAGTGSAVVALLLAAAAAGRARADQWHTAHCRSVIVRSTTLTFVTDFDLASGDAGPAQIVSATDRCSISGLIRARSALAGGTWYRTTSRAEPGERSVTLTAGDAHRLAATATRARLRAAGVRRVDSVFLADAPMARALLLADMHLIEPAIRRRWSRSGLVHLLSVSGVHVAIIAAALLMLGRALRLPHGAAVLLAVGVTGVYVGILGLPPPAVRAAVMFCGVLIAKLRQRPASEWSVLSLGALLPVLVDSAAPLDLGWQLSVLGVVALAASGRFARRLGWKGVAWSISLRRELLASSVASLASTPLIAWFFGTISLIAPLTNLVAAPLVAALQPTLFLALLCSPDLRVARFVAGAAHPLLMMLDGIAAAGSAPFWAAIDLSPTLLQALLGGLLVSGLLAAMVQRDCAPPLLLSALSAVLLMWQGVWGAFGSGVLEVHFLNVGQGDAAAIRTPRGRWILIDAGGGPPGLDHGRRTVLPYLRRLGGPVEVFVLSHPHLDHVGGAPAVIGTVQPRLYFDGAFAGGSEAYRASLESAAVHDVEWRRVHPADTFRVDGVLLRFLAPDSTWTVGLRDANLASTVVRVEYGQTRFLFVGDAEVEEEEWLLQHTPAAWLRAEVLKVGHHGSRTSSGASLLDAIRPSLALVSVGRGNRYGHPSPDVLGEFSRRGVRVLRTDIVGTTVVRTDGRTVSVSTAAHHWRLPFPDSATGSSLP